MRSFELFSVIQALVSLLGIATIDDIEFFLRGLFPGHIAPSKIKQIVSILVGSARLDEIGDFGHLKVSSEKNLIPQIKDGAKRHHDILKLNLSTIYLNADSDFQSLIGV